MLCLWWRFYICSTTHCDSNHLPHEITYPCPHSSPFIRAFGITPYHKPQRFANPIAKPSPNAKSDAEAHKFSIAVL
jgi:hypothetical protein